METQISTILSFLSLIIALISIGLSIKAYNFTKKIRKNDKQPLLEISDIYGGYKDFQNNRNQKPYIRFTFLNTNEKAIVIKINEKTDKNIFCNQLNTTIDNNKFLILEIISNEKIKHEEFNYDIDVFLKNTDNMIYIQTIKGFGFNPIITVKEDKIRNC